MRSNKFAIIGFFISSLIPALIGALLTPINGGIINSNFSSVLGLTFVFYFFSLLAAFTFGGPLFLLFQHFNLIRWWSATSSGCLAGIVVSICIQLPNLASFKSLLVYALIGSFSGLVFWAIWRLEKAA